MNVLSLFDGISCGQVALERAGIPYAAYYASEIETSAIKVTQTNYPSTIQVGDVSALTADHLPQIDLLIGGSPCQGFSFAGKQLNFEDPRSRLFFEYLRLKNELRPRYWLLENVKMARAHQDKISELLGVEPIFIDSADFSAQSRKRLYWTNISIAPWAMSDQKISDILETPIDFFSSISSRLVKRVGSIKGGGIGNRIYCPSGKGSTLTAQSGGTAGNGNFLIGSEQNYRKLSPLECERLQTLPDGYTAGIPNGKRHAALGNGWTVDVIAHIFKGLKAA